MDFAALVYGYHTNKSTPHFGTVNCLQPSLRQMVPNSTCTLGFIHNSSGWQVASHTRSHQGLAFAVDFLVRNVFHATGVIAARVGHGIRRFGPHSGAISSTLMWWRGHLDKHESFEKNSNHSLSTKDIVGVA